MKKRNLEIYFRNKYVNGFFSYSLLAKIRFQKWAIFTFIAQNVVCKIELKAGDKISPEKENKKLHKRKKKIM